MASNNEKIYNINNFQGLSQKEAEKILMADGFNELPSQKKQSWFSILVRVLSEPMLILLLVCGLIYLFMGSPRDALMLLFFVFVVIGITFYQERKTEKTLEALRDLSSPRALVIRDGQQKRIAGRKVVKNDIIILQEGDRVPADAVILSCQNLYADESLLTGESMPARKVEWDEETQNQRPGGDDLPFVYSGSLVTSGRGVARVSSTGVNTEIGKIGKSLEGIKDEDTLLKKETAKIVRTVAIIALTLCVLMVITYILIKGDVVGGLLSGLTLSMAILPEEFPVVLLIFLTLGAWRISKNRVLTRRSDAIETLGAATVLCADKTGTLTLNKMELSNLYADNSFFELNDTKPENLPENFKTLLKYGVLASQKDPFDPIEKELNKMGELYLKGFIKDDFDLIKEYPLSRELLALSHAWRLNDTELVIASKGAPEAILNLCHADDNQKEEVLERVKEMSDKGLRVLGVARATSTLEKLPDNQHDFDFEFIGLLGFIDPIRETAPGAVKEAYGAGMRVIMITGDYPGTAQFIAKKIGIKNPEECLTGEDLEKLSHLELREKIKTVNIFARVVPEQKLLIVKALKDNNEVVAMTGDGVNDAPALKSAHIGVAMGERGTDVAREASSLVLLNDDFSSIVVAVRLGRRIYNNLKRAMGYILSVHVPIAGMSILPLAFNMPMMLLPAHIAFLELIIDPACSTVFESEKEDDDIMKKPPRDVKQPMFNFKTVSASLLQGLGVLIATIILFLFVSNSGRSETEVRSFVFVSLVLANLMLIVVNLSWSKNIHQILKSPNKALYIVFAGAILCLFAVLYIPFFTDLFRLAPLGIKDFLLVILTVFVGLAWFEVLKLFRNMDN
ncbi:MAG: P-type Ca2+ transporter type [Patescibacteria group bacterium]|nr:P-type Ca2+ transporter type [Patescibacteria group bacterium]